MDLNRITSFEKWTNGSTVDDQLKKVTEEFNEVLQANKNRVANTEDTEAVQDMVGELFDLMTAGYNLIYMIAGKYSDMEELFNRHIRKLEKYDITKYASSDETRVLKDRLLVLTKRGFDFCPYEYYGGYQPDCDGDDCSLCMVDWLQGKLRH